MDGFEYRGGRLLAEGVPVERIADSVGTPTYVYSRGAVRSHYRLLADAFAPANPLICYSVKANPNGAVLQTLASAGSGFDIVSGGELFRVACAGGDPAKTVFAGVGKGDEEIREALQANILMFNCESRQEVEVLNDIAGQAGVVARVGIRINPDIKAGVHRHTSTGTRRTKFGMASDKAADLLAHARSFEHLSFEGVHAHIGSQITSAEPFARSLELLLKFARDNRSDDTPLRYVDMGGGLGISHGDRAALPPQQLADRLLPAIVSSPFQLIMEPGRFIVGNAGVLVTRVRYVKESGGKRFVIVDAAMNDFIRPVLYGGYHEIWPVMSDSGPPGQLDIREEWRGDRSKLSHADVVGPVCETADFFARERPLPEVERGDLLAVFSAGAYGASMASSYNSRPRVAEVMVDGETFSVVRERGSHEDLVRGERGMRTVPSDAQCASSGGEPAAAKD